MRPGRRLQIIYEGGVVPGVIVRELVVAQQAQVTDSITGKLRDGKPVVRFFPADPSTNRKVPLVQFYTVDGGWRTVEPMNIRLL